MEWYQELERTIETFDKEIRADLIEVAIIIFNKREPVLGYADRMDGETPTTFR